MNAARHPNSPPPSAGSTAVRSTWWILAAPALALASTLPLVLAGAPGDWIGAIWLVAVLWTIAASLVQALWAGFRYGDWSAFACTDSPCAALPHDDEDHDFALRTGVFAYVRIRERHEALMREDDRCLEEHDRTDSLG